jgi:hypothetical protein
MERRFDLMFGAVGSLVLVQVWYPFDVFMMAKR